MEAFLQSKIIIISPHEEICQVKNARAQKFAKSWNWPEYGWNMSTFYLEFI